ncbi:MAG: diguanylate cyclase [Candidatus Woesearchaeota archaeon]
MNNKDSLEGVLITVSVGIGQNTSEAELALKVAKGKKSKRLTHNIVTYTGSPIKERPLEHSDVVDSYLNLERMLKGQNNEEGLRNLEMMKLDPRTRLLNKLGYAVTRSKMISNGTYRNRIILFMDGDNMKDMNTQYGYSVTDRYITAMGRALARNLRQKNDPGTDTRDSDALGHRYNDSGGDEFIVDLSCPGEYSKNVAKRCIDVMYDAQRQLVTIYNIHKKRVDDLKSRT